MVRLQNDWDDLLRDEFSMDYYQTLRGFLKTAYQNHTVYPAMHDIFNALKFTPYHAVKAVIVGQDPYINQGEAHGLSFSVLPPKPPPPSLANIFKELETDMGCTIPNNGCLEHWARQGVLLLNTVLTVQAGMSKSHAGQGWEQFTDAVLSLVNKKTEPVVFMLWGKDAQRKDILLDNDLHLILRAAHPSPLAGGKFFGCKHFSAANRFLTQNELTPIDWQIPNHD